MRVYIAGPMRGLPQFNFPAFDRAAAMLKDAGHDTVNPADLDREIGFSPEQDTITHGFMREAMRRDLTAVCECDAIAMLPGWESSGGAKVEWMLATYLGLEVIYLESIADNWRDE